VNVISTVFGHDTTACVQTDPLGYPFPQATGVCWLTVPTPAVSALLPLIAPNIALIVVVPACPEVARPPAVTVATLAAEDVQVTLFVNTCWLPSL
jgi:hypothetical protein